MSFLTFVQPHYAEIKWAHIALVSASGSLFAVRGLANLSGASWPLQAPARRLSVMIDVLLLSAGLTLWFLLGLHPARDPWLAVKLSLLLVYIVLGSIGLKRGRTRTARVISLLAALLVLSFMASVAHTHQPLGIFH